MNKKHFFKSLICFLIVSTAFSQNKKPNILFIMSDDHTSQAVGVYGSRLAKLNPTPTIDQLANEGIIMTNAFCANSICTPSRASIMTGQYSAVNGVTTLQGRLNKENQYLAIEMKKAGYETAVIGKWHLKEKPEAFDYFKVLYRQGEYFDPHFLSRAGTEDFTRTVNGNTTVVKGTEVMKGHSSDCIANSTLDWLENKRDTSKPFFMKMHFKAPHDLFQYAPRYESYLADVEIPEPENLFKQGNHGSIATRGHNDELVPYIGTSVLKGEWHYIKSLKGTEELYNLVEDPMEWVNLINDKRYDQIVDDLKRWVPKNRAKSSNIRFKKQPNYVDADADPTIKATRNLKSLE